MTWVAVAIGGSALVGAGASLYGANKQAGAGGNAANQQMAMFGQTQKNEYPWLHRGTQASDQLYADMQNGLGQPFTLDKFQQSPSYQWQLQQGQQAIDKGANARGNYYAPQTLQDLSKYSQGLAGTDFNNAFNQYEQGQLQQFNMLNAVSGAGQNAAAGLGGLGQNAVTNAGNFQTSGAAAGAGGIMGAANSLTGGGLGLAGYQQYLSGLQQQQYNTNTQPYNWSNNPYGSAAAYDNAGTSVPLSNVFGP